MTVCWCYILLSKQKAQQKRFKYNQCKVPFNLQCTLGQVTKLVWLVSFIVNFNQTSSQTQPWICNFIIISHQVVSMSKFIMVQSYLMPIGHSANFSGGILAIFQQLQVAEGHIFPLLTLCPDDTEQNSQSRSCETLNVADLRCHFYKMHKDFMEHQG